MKESNYWEQFIHSGKIEDYLFFRENEMIPDDTRPKAGDKPYAGFCESDRNGVKNSSDRGV